MATYTVKPEHTLQASVAQFFKAWLPADMPWTSVDHGITFRGTIQQRRATWQRLAARGVKAGIHDIPIIVYRGKMHSIELKDTGKPLEDTQIEWGAKLVAHGVTWDVCESRAEVWDSMRRAFPLDCPLKPPPAILQIWLAKDELPPKVRKVSKPPAVKREPRASVAAGHRINAYMVRK